MIRHIFKIIWNERKQNAWPVAEYIIIFCVLWFCCDYVYTMLAGYYGPQGYDIDHVYMIDMAEKTDPEKVKIDADYLEEIFGRGNKSTDIDRYGLAMTFMERVKRYPDIEAVALANAAVPYGGNTWYSGYKIDSDSVNQTLRQRYVTSDFFRVFRIKVRGRIFDWQDNTSENEAIISPFRDNYYGDSSNESDWHDVSDVRVINYDNDWDAIKSKHTVIGTTDKIRDSYYEPFLSNLIVPLKREDVNLDYNQIVVRVKPEADKNFAEKFTKDMREQLFIGPYYLSSVTSIKELKTLKDSGVRDQMNNTYAITLFLIINIFLGILGTFWFRIQARRSEIGLRIALGSSKQKVRRMIIAETIFLLIIAGIVGMIICLNLNNPETIRSLGIPSVDKKEWGIGYEQSIINTIITFIFLFIVSVIAVWYPAKQASKIQPAEALHNE